jgi:predicted phosphate transport protein (TIGR00153 family)
MAKGDKFYFDNFTASTALSKKAALYLVECLENYNPEKIEEMLQKMHEIEHSADKKKHEMNEALIKAFVTPVDREDLAMLSHNLDQVTDKIEEVLQKFYIYNIQAVEPSIIEFAKKLVKSTELLCQLMEEFENFKRSKKIRSIIIGLNDVEEECDSLYLTSMRNITRNPADAYTAISLCKIYDCFEACADACEHASECVDTVIMKNT